MLEQNGKNLLKNTKNILINLSIQFTILKY